jgi:hypothetical protein
MTRIIGKTPVKPTVTKMPSKTPKGVNVVVNIHPGTGLQAQKQAWNRFWQKMIVEVKKEIRE